MNSDQSPSTRPLTYVIIPLLAVFVVCSTFLFFYMRHRRRLATTADGPIWARGRWVTRDGAAVFIPRHYRSNPWGGFRSQEGLNELGEAPPPYAVKKPPGGEGDAAAGGPTELRDMEEGRRPPEYIAEPPPAVTADSRRTGT
ncbi:hypothetical protein Trco_002872 [Trichoderma cornu-damae]|uniref:Uncharacterized protein n=1 Tax=Trichoderma cornu-damae TaxID=654480 RepID=A0A9P8QQS1_9HYPO|nr:hypothetical protein Trco_002872 [Trichoderma cornu-damae]